MPHPEDYSGLQVVETGLEVVEPRQGLSQNKTWEQMSALPEPIPAQQQQQQQQQQLDPYKSAATPYVAGYPASHFTYTFAQAVWNFQATRIPESYLSPDTLKMVQAEAVKQCGDEDGVIEDPLSCHFQLAKSSNRTTT